MSSNEDYLEVDKPIPGQNYVCLSFISPDELIKKKELFTFHQFVNQKCHELTNKIDEITKKSSDELRQSIKTQVTDELESILKFNYDQFKSSYDDFLYKYNDELNTRFEKLSNKKTSVRGVKVRGCYDTYNEAEKRAKTLQRTDRSFHVFVGQVGYWLPWDPNADRIESEEYLEEELNTLMKEYKQNEVNKDIFYEEQKREKIKEDMIKRQKAEKEKQAQVTEALDEPDPWLQSKFNTDESADAGDAANTDTANADAANTDAVNADAAANTDAANADTANADAAAANADANLTEEKVKVV